MEKNEYGAPLDSNGYAPSIMQDDLETCFLCGRIGCNLNRHEIYHADKKGVLREKSKRYGLWAMLCHDACHQNGKFAVHKNHDIDMMLKQKGQEKAMEHYGWTIDDFREVFGKSYL